MRTVISHKGNRYTELVHNPGDPSVWKVQRSNKFLWFRWNSTTTWFTSEPQARAYAQGE